jgi:predicted N-acetyltransferase YhbS
MPERLGPCVVELPLAEDGDPCYAHHDIQTKEISPLRHTVRAAHHAEFPLLRAIIARAFKGDEADLWDCLAEHDPAFRPEGVRVAEGPDGRPVACTVVLPRLIRTRRGYTDGAVITLVACEPGLQGQGYGGATVRDALAYMEAQGLTVAILYGHPTYYPRFGFVPVLPTLLTTLGAAEVPGDGALLRAAADNDLPWITVLYTQQVAIYPCATARDADPWLWHPRGPGHALLALPDQAGYAFVSFMADRGLLYVHEAATTDGHRLLGALAAEARSQGLAELKLNLAPDNPVALAAAAQGAQQDLRPAAAGMAAVINWAPLLPAGMSTPAGADRTSLTQAVLGYTPLGGLPALFPKWSLEPFWS